MLENSNIATGATLWQSFVDVLFLTNYSTRLVVISVTILGAASGLIGVFLLLRRRSLMADTLSHATLPGIAVAFLIMTSLGGSGKWLPGLLLGATLTGLLGVWIMESVLRSTHLNEDTVLAVVLSVFFGAGIALLGIIQSLPGAAAAGLESFIYGKVASMVFSDFVLISLASLICLLIGLLLFKEFGLLAFDRSYAEVRGWPTATLDLLLAGLMTGVVVVGLQAAGLILVLALLITPAAAARFWSDRLPFMAALAIGFGALSGWLGASISALFPGLPAGALIVLVAASLFLISLIAAPTRGVFPRWLCARRLQRRVNRQHLLRAMYELAECTTQNVDRVHNEPLARVHLLAKRSWRPEQLRRILRVETKRGHIQEVDGDKLQLTESGFGEAARVTRNHRLWEAYLMKHAAIAPSHVDRDADLVEHVLDAELVRELEEALKERGAWVPPLASPHSFPAYGGKP